MLVGSAVDNTAGTLTAPDLDLNIEWRLGHEVSKYLDFVSLDDGLSGQYEVRILAGKEIQCKLLLRQFIIDIQN